MRVRTDESRHQRKSVGFSLEIHPQTVGASKLAKGARIVPTNRIEPLCTGLVERKTIRFKPVRLDITGDAEFDSFVKNRKVSVKTDLFVEVDPRPCHHSRQMHLLLKFGTDLVSSFHRCVCNEFNSITKRHVVQQLPVGTEAALRMLKVARDIINRLQCEGLMRKSKLQVISSRPQRMRKRYMNVIRNDLRKGRGKSFIKFEKHPSTKLDAVPRLIQYRSSEYTLCLARYTTVMEEAIKFRNDWSMDANKGMPIISKGMNAHEKGQALFNMWNSCKNPVAHLIDHSKFDSMVSEAHHMIERFIMCNVFKDDLVDYLYGFQAYNRFVSQNGIRYEFPYRRCSGDANTSLGNSLINYCILRSVFPEAVIIVDGDDSVVVTEKGIQPNMDFKQFGMKTKHEIVDIFEHVEFCQSRPVMTPIGWVMCRNPLRAISRMNIRLGRNDNLKDYLWTVGIGEGLSSAYMPILTAISKRFRDLGKGGRFKPWELDYRIKIDRFSNRFEMPTSEVRASFAIAWGINVDEQISLESAFAAAVLYNGH